jgi:hypothetical protein
LYVISRLALALNPPVGLKIVFFMMITMAVLNNHRVCSSEFKHLRTILQKILQSMFRGFAVRRCCMYLGAKLCPHITDPLRKVMTCHDHLRNAAKIEDGQTMANPLPMLDIAGVPLGKLLEANLG